MSEGGDEVGSEAVLDGNVHGLGGNFLVGRTGNVAVQGYGVLAIALVEREGSILAARAVAVNRRAAVVLDADLELGARGVVNGYITVGRVARVNNVIRCRCGETHREDSCCKNCACKTKKPLHIRRSPFGNWLPALSEG